MIFLIQIEVSGTTGPIHFDQDGLRDAFYIEVVDFLQKQNYDIDLIAKYRCPSVNNSYCDPNERKGRKGENVDSIEYIVKNKTSEEVIATGLKGRNIKVIMRLGEPFLMVK